MPEINIQEGLSLLVGDSDVDNSKHLVIQEYTLPNMEEMSAKHHAGGSYGEIDIGGLGFNALEFKFKLTGFDAQTMFQWGVYGQPAVPYTALGAFRDRLTAIKKPLKAIMRGRMTGAQSDALKRGDLFAQEFAVKEIIHYELWFDDKERVYWDLGSSVYRINGVSQNAELNTMLMIP